MEQCVIAPHSLILAPPLLMTEGVLKMSGLHFGNPSSVISVQPKEEQTSKQAVPEVAVKPKKKICCACPDTKKLRDECIVEHGESACAKWIDAHRRCLRAEGFNV